MGWYGKKNTDQDIDHLFCMPQVLIELMERCLEGAAADALAEVVLRDAALVSRILSAATRPGMDSLDPVDPVSSALERLGDGPLTTLALQAARDVVRHRFTPQQLSFQYDLWYAAQVGSLFARCLAPSVDYPRIEEAQLCGLLLNIGIQILFSRDRRGYPEQGMRPWGDQAQCRLEAEKYATDHVQLGDELIRQWHIDSFLADALCFLYADIAQLEQCGPLLKIARLVQQLGKSPHTLTDQSTDLAHQLFGLQPAETTYLFDWAAGLFPEFGHSLADPEALQAQLDTDLQRLSELSFLLADQEAARARLAEERDLDRLLAVARGLYLENNGARDAFFFLVDQENLQLTGIPAPEQPRQVGEMTIPLVEGASLAATALLRGEAIDAFQAGASLTVTDQILTRLCRSSGLSCHPFQADGKKLGVIVLGIDAEMAAVPTSRFKMLGPLVSRALAAMSNRVDDHFAENNSLLRRVKHEVSGPLTVIGNYAEVLNRVLQSEESRDMAGSIRDEVRRVDDILNYYLNRQELPDFPEYRIDVNYLLRDIVASLEEGEIKPRQIRVGYELQHDLPKIATNPLLVKHILVNLIKNAAEAVSVGGKIELSTRDGYASDRGRYVEIIVSDDGPGIDPDILPHLFKPVRSPKGAGHSGVGLSIVKGMVDDLGARISCHSSAGSGTSFCLQLPDHDS